MIINDVENKKGFKNFPTSDIALTLKYYKNDLFLTDTIPIDKNGFENVFNTYGAISPTRNIVDKEYFISSKKENKKDLRNLNNFLEEGDKVFYIDISLEFYHFFMDSFSNILLLYKNNPKSLFIINYSVDEHIEKQKTFLLILKDFLSKNNIKHILLESDYLIALNNFYYISMIRPCDEQIDLIFDFSRQYVKDKNSTPTKKVFLSRRYTDNQRSFHNTFDYFNKNWNWIGLDEKEIIDFHDIRMHNEIIFCDFIKDIGYEIIYPEKFTSIYEQIDFFNDVKTIISPTSASLINSIFMQPGGNVIELITPMLPGHSGNFDLHSFHYLDISYVKKHNYFGIPNKIDAKNLIDYLQNNKQLMNLLES